MIIYNDPGHGNKLERVYTGPRVKQYRAIINGWYAGGFSAKTDTAARERFIQMLHAETGVIVK